MNNEICNFISIEFIKQTGRRIETDRSYFLILTSLEEKGIVSQNSPFLNSFSIGHGNARKNLQPKLPINQVVGD